MHPHTKYHWPIWKDKKVMFRTRKYYLKNHYLTLRSKIKVPRRSLWYVTHRLMVMHPHTKYNWPIWKDKKVMVRTSFAEKKQKKQKQKKRKKKIRLKQYVSLRLKGRHNYTPHKLVQYNILLGTIFMQYLCNNFILCNACLANFVKRRTKSLHFDLRSLL